MKPIHVAVSPLTNTIFAGTVRKDGQTWGLNRTDVTGCACGAVAEHVMNNGGSMVVSLNGEPMYKISVELLNNNQPVPTEQVEGE